MQLFVKLTDFFFESALPRMSQFVGNRLSINGALYF